MSEEEDDDQSRPNNEKQHNHKNKKLWQEMKINFQLVAFKFPDNKIYGIVTVIPESSRILIEKFKLVIDKRDGPDFDPHYQTIAVSGFSTNRKTPSVYIKAIRKDENDPKTSQICYFFFTGRVFSLSPTISFRWSDNPKKPEPILGIHWFHLGDKVAQKYILYLDDVDIQYIRQKQIEDEFNIKIMNLKPGGKHTFQLVGKLNYGKDTYRSDLMEFTVPKEKPTDGEELNEFLTVSDEPIPLDLPVVFATDQDKTEEPFPPKIQPPPVSKPAPDKQIHPCCDKAPHNEFPGIEHYLSYTPHRPPIPTLRKRTTTEERQTKSSQ